MAVAFPESLLCYVTDGFSEGFPSLEKYLGARTDQLPSTANVKVRISSHVTMEQFTRWYLTDIIQGNLTFTVNLPLFGVLRAWEVKLTNKISTTPLATKESIRYITLNLELIEDINDYISV